MSAIGAAEARELLEVEGAELVDLLSRAARLRIERRGMTASPCAIVNARCGSCGEDCAFCAQSRRSRAEIDRFALLSAERIVAAARGLLEAGAVRVGIVTSGRATDRDRELEVICDAVAAIAPILPAGPCASLGLLGQGALGRLRDAGLGRYHHNLETAESFFPSICTTRSWSDSIATVEAAVGLGLSVCCGGILGLGESPEQRVELLETIAGLEVDSVPLNFLHPIPGTPLEGLRELSPLACLKVVALARLMMPDREIRVCGGRELNLRDLHSWALFAGADGVMVGGYLTTSGRRIADDMQMLADAGLEVARPAAAGRQGGIAGCDE
jgi:biotin synthase